jgi:acyl-CoA synthetase (AMP-forming)/AMP-acid ligase II
MAFWSLDSKGSAVALLAESGATLTYAELGRVADQLAAQLPESPARTVGFLLFPPNFDAVAVYLGTLRSGRHVPLLLPRGIHSALLDDLISRYQPDWIATGTGPQAGWSNDYRLRYQTDSIAIHVREERDTGIVPREPLGLLLSTSGSTGSRKLVRLAYEAIESNARAIAQYLRLTERDRAISTLELSYSFGMSILNSHLAAGASMVLTEQTLLSRGFWEVAQKSHVTSLSGVPSQFEMLRRAGLERRGLGSLRMLTQAGGNLSEPLKREFKALTDRLGSEFFVMYGQTEAAPRISYVPPARLEDKLGSIGVAIPGGSLDLDPATGELIYSGPNVMLGYAENRADLARGDELRGVLHTGDIGRRDAEGFFYLTGRLKRFIKLSGARVNLDDLEGMLVNAFDAQLACVGTDDRLNVVLAESATVTDAQIREFLRVRCDIYAGLVAVERRGRLPLTANGKIDYQALTRPMP